MKITSLERAKTSNRVNVFVDGKYSFSIEEPTLLKYHLYSDKEIDTQEIEQIQKYDIYQYALSQSLKYINIRRRSEHEIREFLQRKLTNRYKSNIFDTSISKVIGKLNTIGLLDDNEFAKWIIESMIAKGNKSQKEIEQKLIKFGILKETYSPILNNLFNNDTEKALISNIIEKKMRTSKIKNLSKKERKIKLINYLARKGFKIDSIFEVLKSINY